MVIARSVRIVPEYERLVMFRLGRMIGVRGPGLVVLVPFIDSATKVDLREFVVDIPPQTCITKDNAPVDIDLLVYMKVFDPALAVTSVSNYVTAATGIAMITIKNVRTTIQMIRSLNPTTTPQVRYIRFISMPRSSQVG